jgi:hypothetical protein
MWGGCEHRYQNVPPELEADAAAVSNSTDVCGGGALRELQVRRAAGVSVFW